MAKILVVDDNAQNRALVQAALGDEGYVVLTAANGADGLRAFQEHNPDCVMLDVRMPGEDGPATCRAIRALPHGADVPIVFLTAQRDVDTFDRALAAGGDDFLTKPVQPSELVLRVQAALKLRRMKVELSEHYALVRRQRDDLMRLQLQKERLTQFLVHDLKNPVGALDLNAQMLLRDKTLSDSARTYVLRMRSDVRGLLRMILNLLDISRSDEEGLHPRRETIDVEALCTEVLEEHEIKARTAGVRLTKSVTVETLSGDPGQIRRVLENLLENAIRHAPEDSEVRISFVRKDACVELRVADQGPGVALDEREKIFDPFVQLDHGERLAQRTGRGLGLTFCKVAVEAHGGKIWIEDGNPGAIFCVTLPQQP